MQKVGRRGWEEGVVSESLLMLMDSLAVEQVIFFWLKMTEWGKRSIGIH